MAELSVALLSTVLCKTFEILAYISAHMVYTCVYWFSSNRAPNPTFKLASNQELEAAYEQLKLAFAVKKEKLVEANAALATSYQDAEDLRRKLANAESNIIAYNDFFAKAKNIGQEVLLRKLTSPWLVNCASAGIENCQARIGRTERHGRGVFTR